MEEAIAKLKEIVDELETAIPAVKENPVKAKVAYKTCRQRTQDAILELKKIRYEAGQLWNKEYYKGKPRKPRFKKAVETDASPATQAEEMATDGQN